MSTRIYDLSDFPNSLVNLDNLTDEIRSSSITIALDYISTSGTTVDIVFKAALSVGEETILDGIVAAHDNVCKVPPPTIVQVQEEYGATNGKFISQSFWITAPIGVSNTDTIFDLPTSILEIQFITRDENLGDSVKLYVFRKNTGYGEGVIGTITANVSAGATGIHVSSTIANAVLTGDYISLKEGSKEEDLGLIKSIDKVNNILYMKTPTATSFSATSPTLVKHKRYVLYDFPLGPPWKMDIGGSKIGGSYVTPDYIVRVEYTNNGLISKQLYSVIERLE